MHPDSEGADIYISRSDETFNEAEIFGGFSNKELSENKKFDQDDYIFYITKSGSDEVLFQSEDINYSYPSQYVMVIRENFGSGSSREHAAWSVYDYGFRCVISSFFADIFKGNCLNIGVLPVQVSPEFADKIFAAIEANPKTEIEVSLPTQTVTLVTTGESETFDINGYKKENMLNGFDDIDYLQNIKGDIKAFAANSPL